MAFRQYPEPIAVIICDGLPHIIDLGKVLPPVHVQTQVIGVQLFKHGMQPNVRLRMNAYNASATLIGTSLPVFVRTLDALAEVGKEDFDGWVRFTFEPRINISSATPTRLELTLENYAFSEATWIGAILDWPITMGYNNSPGQISATPVALELYGAVAYP